MKVQSERILPEEEDTVWEDRQGRVRWYDVFKQMPLLTYQLPNLVRYGVPLPIAFM